MRQVLERTSMASGHSNIESIQQQQPMTETQMIDDMLGETYIVDTPEKISRDIYLESLNSDEHLRLIQSSNLVVKMAAAN